MPTVDVTEVDAMLDGLASNCRSSDHTGKLRPTSSEERDKLFSNIFKRLDPTQSKWLIRLILKDFSTVRVDETLVLQSFHFLLPDLLRFQNSFEAAIRLLRSPLKEYPDSPDPRSRRLHRQRAAELLEPAVGIKVGRPEFYKARSIDHCIRMCGAQRWVLERKYDGEYCEIHIDMSRSPTPSKCITIFSKSGKNSTDDRKGLHSTLVDCLHLGTPRSKIKRQAILLGELVVYSDQHRCVLPFEKIRKHVTRSGVFLRTDQDSQPHIHEHTAIVFYDLLLLDEEVVMRKPLQQRRMWLREVYTKVNGRAMGAEWKIVDFGRIDHAKNVLIQQFAASIAERCEGLILKPCDLPYFSLDQTATSGYIKLKKDYIAGMGDEADFAVIGGSYNSQQALKSGLPKIKYTEFHLGCLTNRDNVLRFDIRPRFRVVGKIQFEHCIPKPILQTANALGIFCAKPFRHGEPPSRFDVEFGNMTKTDVVFDEPFVFEVLGSGFEKPSNCNFFMLRHPRVKKLHQDRTWKDCISMQELQEQAAAVRAAPPDSESQETRRLIARLEAKCKKKAERQRTSTPGSTPRTALKPPIPRATLAVRRSPRAKSAGGTTSASTDSLLDGTTLLNAVSRGAKRPREELAETPCPPEKKQNTKKVERKPSKDIGDSSRRKAAPRMTTPLADITNIGAHPSSRPIPAKPSVSAAKGVGGSIKGQLLPVASIIPEMRDKITTYGNDQCIGTLCLFANAVVFATSCIATTPYIVEDLLHAHDVVLVPTIAHWDRDSLAHPPMTEIVSESQAFDGMRKIILVEGKRAHAVETSIRQIQALNGGKWRERVELYDWRVLEECADHSLGLVERKKYFLGATMSDESADRAIFVESAR